MVIIYDEATVLTFNRRMESLAFPLFWTMPTPEFMERTRKELLRPCPEDCCPKPCICDDCPACFGDDDGSTIIR